MGFSGSLKICILCLFPWLKIEVTLSNLMANESGLQEHIKKSLMIPCLFFSLILVMWDFFFIGSSAVTDITLMTPDITSIDRIHFIVLKRDSKYCTISGMDTLYMNSLYTFVFHFFFFFCYKVVSCFTCT